MSQMHDLLSRRVLSPLACIILMQSAIVMSSYGITVVVPDAAGDIGIPPEWVGYLFAIVYGTASFSGIISGRIISAWGATGAFRVMMAAIALGAFALIGASPLLAFLAAALIGLATGPMNPVGSHVLTRISPTGWAAFLFSVKQCATPAGGALAGIIFPPLVVIWGWQVAFMVMPFVAILFCVCAGWGRLDDGDEIEYSGQKDEKKCYVMESLRLSLAGRQVAAVSIAGMLFAGSQCALIAFLVVYLRQTELMTAGQAGLAFSVFHVSGVVARLVFGWFAERCIPSAAILVFAASGMAVGLVSIANFSQSWPLWTFYLAIAFAGCTGNGWVGLLFAELSRLAPEGRAADVTGGAQVFMYAGVFITPLACSTALDLTDSNYDVVFVILTALAIGSVLSLEWGRRAGR